MLFIVEIRYDNIGHASYALGTISSLYQSEKRIKKITENSVIKKFEVVKKTALITVSQD